MKYRSRIEITNVMLESARVGATKIKLMYKAYLSYFQVTEYLKYLQQNDLLTYEKDTNLYKPTEKGLKFLNLSNELNEMTLVTNLKNYKYTVES